MRRIHQINLQTRFPQHRATARVSSLSTSQTLSTAYPPSLPDLSLRFYGSADWAQHIDPSWLPLIRNIHGSTIAGNYVVMATRWDYPQTIFIGSVLSPDYWRIIFPPSPHNIAEYDWSHDYGYRYVPSHLSLPILKQRYSICDGACYNPITKTVFLDFIGCGSNALSVIELYPKTGTWASVIFDVDHIPSYSLGGSAGIICCDDDYLYLATVGGKVDGEWISGTVHQYHIHLRDDDGHLLYGGSCQLRNSCQPHSIGIDHGRLYVFPGYSGDDACVIDTATMSILASATIPERLGALTDDLTITPTDIWCGTELGTAGLAAFDKSTLAISYELPLNDTSIVGNYCFGAFHIENYIYAVFGNVPIPVIARLNLETMALQYSIFPGSGAVKDELKDQWGFNEICHHPATGLLFASLWDEAPPVIARFHPSQITWIDLDISQTQLPAPLFTLPPSPFTSHSLFTLSCENAAAAIYYTFDGSTPTAASTLYTAPFAPYQVGSVTIRAIAILEGFLDSDISEEVLTLVHPLSAIDTLGAPIQPILHNDYYYLVFRQIGANSLNVLKAVNIDYLLLGGGGSGARSNADAGCGGGGAGAVANGSYAVDRIMHTITIGSGGLGVGGVANIYGNNGNPTSILVAETNILTAIGGGGGGMYNRAGLNGGCGGGAGARYSANLYHEGGIGIGGNRGGRGASLNGPAYIAGGGGGGLGAPGSDAAYGGSGILGNGGNGGLGIALSDIWPGLTGELLGLAFSRFGGGGGAVGYSAAERMGQATDGGTPGARMIVSANAPANQGGGSGGCDRANNSGNGGSGLAIIRWRSNA